MPNDEQAIYEQFKHTTMTIVTAIDRLERIGYSFDEAKAIVDEWADDLSNERIEEELGRFRW